MWFSAVFATAGLRQAASEWKSRPHVRIVLFGQGRRFMNRKAVLGQILEVAR